MDNETIVIKVKQRLNKLDSQDYDNVQGWQIAEAFNKGMVEWCRRQLRGSNMFKDGDEQSKRRIDDLQILLVPELPLPSTAKGLYYESDNVLPADYFEYKRLDANAFTDCCPGDGLMTIYLSEEDNRSQTLKDYSRKPSFEWRETFATLIANRVRIYTNDEFELRDVRLTYYRQPRRIEIAGTRDPYTGNLVAANVICEFKDDIVELLIDEAASIIAGDIESGMQYQRNTNNPERNN